MFKLPEAVFLVRGPNITIYPFFKELCAIVCLATDTVIRKKRSTIAGCVFSVLTASFRSKNCEYSITTWSVRFDLLEI